MIKIRYRQRWYEFTCECDRVNNWHSLVKANVGKPVVIRNIECRTCAHLFAGEGKKFEKFRISDTYINIPINFKIIGDNYTTHHM